MTKKHIELVTRILLSLFLACLVWVWLRYAGAFWLSDSLHFMEHLLKSFSTLKTSLYAYLILIAPTILVTFLVHTSMSYRLRVAFYTVLGCFYSAHYLLFMAKLDIAFIQYQIWVYLTSGAVAGLCYALILDMPWRLRGTPDNNADVLPGRRKLLGSLGLFAGTVGFFGALAGPIYFWRNRDSYIDINVARLEEGQMMTVEVANKPVWILRRSQAMINLLEQDNPQLLDPLSESSQQPTQARNALRSIRPEYFVAYGICTHLGCSPTYLSQPQGKDRPHPDPQFFCPCHGGVFDLAGRVYINTPPPTNLIVPEHSFISKDVVRLYYPSLDDEWKSA